MRRRLKSDQDSRECATGGTKVSLAAFLTIFYAAPLSHFLRGVAILFD
jgi:hypothetical protein